MRTIGPAQKAGNNARCREQALEDPIPLVALSLQSSLKQRARRKGIPVDEPLRDVRFLEAWLRAQPNWLWCEVKFSATRYKGRSREAASLDRLRPDQGYTLANTRLICVGCNGAKSNVTAQRHRQIADYIERETAL